MTHDPVLRILRVTNPVESPLDLSSLLSYRILPTTYSTSIDFMTLSLSRRFGSDMRRLVTLTGVIPCVIRVMTGVRASASTRSCDWGRGAPVAATTGRRTGL